MESVFNYMTIFSNFSSTKGRLLFETQPSTLHDDVMMAKF